MTDLVDVLPDFDLKPWRHLLYSLEKNDIHVSELIALDPIEVVRRCPLPIRDLRDFISAINTAIQHNLGLIKQVPPSESNPPTNSDLGKGFPNAFNVEEARCVKTLDSLIDEHLGGGIYTGHVTEFVGESAVGKTQFVLSLLLSTQLLPPKGLGKSAIYLSTESPLSTRRLSQMLTSSPEYQDLSPDCRPSLDKIHTIEVRDLEAQEHVIQYQLPIAIKQFDVGLVVMDSVAANFRAEFEGGTAKNLAERAVQLVRLGKTLNRIAQDNNVAIVVTNQVSDRFEDSRVEGDRIRTSSPALASSQSRGTPGPALSSLTQGRRNEVMSLDFQQRYFTGWGDERLGRSILLKTPALGLTWCNQISTRIVLKMGKAQSHAINIRDGGGQIVDDQSRRRFLSVVFSSWAEPTIPIEYELKMRGPVSVEGSDTTKVETSELEDDDREELTELLDPRYWTDGANDDNEFP